MIGPSFLPPNYKRSTSVGEGIQLRSSPTTTTSTTTTSTSNFNMAGLGKEEKARAPSKTRSARAELKFPVGRVHRRLKQGNYSKRVGAAAPVFLAAIMQHLVAEILDLAGNAAKDNKRSRINPRHLQLAIRNDHELSKLLSGVTLAQGGVLPSIQAVLLPKKSKKKN